MIIKIITEQLANKLPKNSELQKHYIVNPANFDQLYQLLKSKKIYEIYITDATSSSKKEPGTIISVQNHINRTGSNILIGKQKLLGIDIIDTTTPYTHKINSIITTYKNISKWYYTISI